MIMRRRARQGRTSWVPRTPVPRCQCRSAHTCTPRSVTQSPLPLPPPPVPPPPAPPPPVGLGEGAGLVGGAGAGPGPGGDVTGDVGSAGLEGPLWPGAPADGPAGDPMAPPTAPLLAVAPGIGCGPRGAPCDAAITGGRPPGPAACGGWGRWIVTEDTKVYRTTAVIRIAEGTANPTGWTRAAAAAASNVVLDRSAQMAKASGISGRLGLRPTSAACRALVSAARRCERLRAGSR